MTTKMTIDVTPLMTVGSIIVAQMQGKPSGFTDAQLDHAHADLLDGEVCPVAEVILDDLLGKGWDGFDESECDGTCEDCDCEDEADMADIQLADHISSVYELEKDPGEIIKHLSMALMEMAKAADYPATTEVAFSIWMDN